MLPTAEAHVEMAPPSQQQQQPPQYAAEHQAAPPDVQAAGSQGEQETDPAEVLLSMAGGSKPVALAGAPTAAGAAAAGRPTAVGRGLGRKRIDAKMNMK